MEKRENETLTVREIKQILNELLDCSKRFVGVQVGFFVRWDEEPILRCSESPP